MRGKDSGSESEQRGYVWVDGQGMIHPIIFVKPFNRENFLEEKQGRAQDFSQRCVNCEKKSRGGKD